MPSSSDDDIRNPIDQKHSSHSESSEQSKSGPEEEEEGDDASSDVPDDGEETNHASQEINSEGYKRDLVSVRTSPENDEAIVVSKRHGFKNTVGANISVDHSNELPPTHSIDGDVEPSDSGRPVISTSEDSKNNTIIQKEKKSSSEALKKVLNNNEEVHGIIASDYSRDSERDTAICSEKEMKSPVLKTLRRRPRSESPNTDEFENINKRPAMVCEFYAKGWCVKGKSCRFLHQKDNVDNAGQLSKGDLSGSSRRGEFQEIAAVRKEAINTSDSSKLYFHQFHENNKFLPVQREDLSLGVLPRRDFQPFPLARDDPRLDSSVTLNRQDLSPIPMVHEDSTVYGRSFEAPSIQEKHLLEETRNNSIPNYRFFSAGPSSSPNIYGNYTNWIAHDRNLMDATILKQKTQFSCYDAHPPSNLNGSLNTTYSTSLQSTLFSPSHPSSGLSGSLSAHGSSPLSKDLLIGPKLLETDAVYSVTGSATLKPRSSFSSFLRPEAEYLPISGESKTYSYSNSWKPSIPFRSSFVFPSASLSSSESQYDPLLDSIELPNGGKEKYIQNFPPEQSNGDHAITGERGLYPPTQSHGSLLEANFYRDGVYVPMVETGPEKENAVSITKEEKGWSLGHHSEMGPIADNLTHQLEGGQVVKDSKTLKYFRAGLVDFVKELMKPFWRNGHLSKDAHKTIVKKVVEKVLSALQPHQVPSTPEYVNQYLSSSRPKLVKLVEGYVDKYTKE